MLTYDIHNRNGQPIYYHLYQCIRQDIIEGRLPSDEKLPSKRSLARHLSISLITVEAAYEQLLTEGYIRSIQRKGYFVENISNYRAKAAQPANIFSVPENEKEPEFLMDFKANRISLSKFPASIWGKYMREALSLSQDILYKPVSYKGLYELRVAIADYLKNNRDMTVDPGQIIIGAGTEYLYSRLIQLLGRDCVFAMEDPGYNKIAKISASYGNRWEHIPLDDDGLRVDILEESGADVVHVSPANHFPTGTVMSITRRLELFEWVNRINKRYIIEDDYDSEFRYNGRMILPMYAADVNEKVIYINTFSKTLVPTLRISYMVLPKKLLNRYEKTMSFYSCTVSSFEQYTLARFISEGHLERHINRMRKYYKSIRAQILEEIHNSPLAAVSQVIEREAGTHFLLEVRTEMTQEAIRDAGIRHELLLNFYSEYSTNGSKPGTCTLVINYASIHPENIKDVVKRLCEVLI